MSETAVQLDIEPAPPVGALDDLVGPQPLSQREAVMEEVVNARLEDLREDGLEIPPDDAGEAEAEDGETPLPEPEGDGRELLPGEPLYTVKVDGQERQVPLSEITASYQIQAAAQNRLDHASQILRQTQETQQGVQGQTAATAPAVQQQSSGGLDGIDWGGLAERLQYGDTDAAAAALKETATQLRGMGGPGGASATPEQIELRVLDRFEWTTALNRFGEDYQDILADARVAGIAGSFGRALYHQALQDSQMNGTSRRPYWDILNEAGEQTREWLKGLTGQQAGDSSELQPNGEQPAVALSPERGQRKRAAPQPPVPRSGVARSGAGRDKAPKSDEQRYREGFRDIQRGRGQGSR